VTRASEDAASLRGEDRDIVATEGTMITPDLVPAAMMAAAIAPALILLWLAVAADSRVEPARLVLVALLLGAASTAAASVVEVALQAVVPAATAVVPLAIENAVLFAAIPEELLKVALIAAIVLRSRDIDEPMDGVVYGTAVGLGFAMLENLLYVLGGDTNWPTVAAFRGVLSVPLHGACGAIAGAYLARVRFTGILGSGRGTRWRRPRLFALALAVPTALHGMFDAGLFVLQLAPSGTADSPAGALALVVAVLFSVAVGIATITIAVVLAVRISDRQAAWMKTRRLPAGHWRDVWAECLIGLGLSFVGITVVVAGASAIAKAVGFVLMAAAASLAWRCARRLNAMAASRHRHAVAVP
jgi:RsiW-degrading membrane proteinase PrsW (M82 family)